MSYQTTDGWSLRRMVVWAVSVLTIIAAALRATDKVRDAAYYETVYRDNKADFQHIVKLRDMLFLTYPSCTAFQLSNVRHYRQACDSPVENNGTPNDFLSKQEEAFIKEFMKTHRLKDIYLYKDSVKMISTGYSPCKLYICSMPVPAYAHYQVDSHVYLFPPSRR